MSMIPFSQFTTDDPEQPFHSNAYARAAQGGRIGSVGRQSFSERRQLERSRQHVRRYGHSQLGAQAGRALTRPLLVQPRETALNPTSLATRSAEYHYQEPPRRFNPYS